MIEPTELPKMLPVKCPVCNGFGTVSHDKIECHGCKGKGFVWSPNGVYEEWMKTRQQNG